MKQTVITRKLTVEVLSPLHIGNGERISVKEFAKRGGELFIVDPDKLTRRVAGNRELESAFEDFCLGRDFLGDFLHNQKVPFDSVAAYRVNPMGSSVREIYPVVKTPGYRPYLPGSSLKGGVRSALLRAALLGDSQRLSQLSQFVRRELQELRRFKQQNQGNAERIRRQTQATKNRVTQEVESYFGSDQHHCFLRTLHFSDSQPLEAAALQVADLRVLSTSRDGSLRIKQTRDGGRDMILCPEAFRVGTRLACTVTFEHHLLTGGSPADALGFAEHRDVVLNFVAECQRAGQELLQREVDFYRTHPCEPVLRWCEAIQKQPLKSNECLLHFAWGSGFDAKTVTDLFGEPLLDDLRWAFDRMRGKTERSGDRSTLVKPFPKSRKVCCENGQPKMPLGWVKLTLHEEGS